MIDWGTVVADFFEGQVLPTTLRIVTILLLAWLAYRLLAILVQRVQRLVEDEDHTTVSEREQRAQTLGKVVLNTGWGLIALIAVGMILRELGLDIGPFIAGVGIVGLAVGFGAQTLVKDVISGFFILLEDQFAVGDSIQVGSIAGSVEKMTLRATFLRDAEGTCHVVPNGEIRILANKTKGWARAVVKVGVAYEEKLDHVFAVLEQISQETYQDEHFGPQMLEQPTVLGPMDFGDSAMTMQVMVRTQPGKQWGIGRELRRRIKERFEQEGIEMPYPQYEIRMRQ